MSPKLGDRLVAAGLVSREAVEQALEQQRLTGHRLGDSLVEMGLLGEAVLLRFLASELKTRYVSAEKLARAQIASDLLDRVPVRLAEAHHFLPLAVDDERRILSIVAAEPQNEKLLRDVAAIADVDEVYAYIALRSVVRAGIQKHYYADTTAFASLTSGPRASRADLAGIAAAYESAGSSKQVPPVPLRLRGEGSQARTPAGRTSRPTTGRERARRRTRGVGETDYLETLRVLVDQLERGRGELRGHSAQLARQASLVAIRLGLPSREVSCVALAAYLHDLGKGPIHLTIAGTARNPEWKAEARKLALAPVHMFEAVHLPAQVGATLAQLYEAWDGSGTPQGAHGEDIAIGARILAAVDSWLDLTRNPANTFGRLFTREQALSFMAEQAGTLFDPRVVEMVELLHSGELLRRRLESDGRQVLVADPEPARRDAVVHALGQEGAGGARHEHARGRDGGGGRVGPVAVLVRARRSGDCPGGGRASLGPAAGRHTVAGQRRPGPGRLRAAAPVRGSPRCSGRASHRTSPAASSMRSATGSPMEAPRGRSRARPTSSRRATCSASSGAAGSRGGWRSERMAPRGSSSSSGAAWCGQGPVRSGARRR